jgi:hypothetical protein
MEYLDDLRDEDEYGSTLRRLKKKRRGKMSVKS